MLVLDRSGSMTAMDGTGTQRIASLKTAVNGFLGLSNMFSANDRIGMTSFATRGCGDAGIDSTSTAVPCPPDAILDFATSSYISTLQGKVNALVAANGTNTMEGLRTAGPPLAAAFTDPTRATTRKAVLLVTDGQPTYMRRDSATECMDNPKLPGNDLPAPGNTGWSGQCLHGVSGWNSGAPAPWMRRYSLTSFVATGQNAIPNLQALIPLYTRMSFAVLDRSRAVSPTERCMKPIKFVTVVTVIAPAPQVARMTSCFLPSR